MYLPVVGIPGDLPGTVEVYVFFALVFVPLYLVRYYLSATVPES